MSRRDSDSFGNLVCSFCGKSQREVKKLIAGPTVHICDECIELCNDIIAEEAEKEDLRTGLTKIPKPSEIKNVLDDYVIGQDNAKKTLSVGRPGKKAQASLEVKLVIGAKSRMRSADTAHSTVWALRRAGPSFLEV